MLLFADHVNAHSLIRDVHTTWCVAESGLGLTGFIYNLLFVFSISQFEGKFDANKVLTYNIGKATWVILWEAHINCVELGDA